MRKTTSTRAEPLSSEPSPCGLLIVDKPGGISSHGVVSRVRRILGTRKVGHGGTLDPMATGVLVVGVGRATKLLGFVSGDSKTYLATIRLGISTTTEDAEGDVVESPGASELVAMSSEELAARVDRAIGSFTGSIEQIPSAVSAIKVDGKRAYALVRDGVDVQLKARTVSINEYARTSEPRAHVFHGIDVVDVDVVVDCSSGTYIRALARDTGLKLGTVAHLTSLRRTRVGTFSIKDARSLDELEQLEQPQAQEALMPLSQAVRQLFPVITVATGAMEAFTHGREFSTHDIEGDGDLGTFDPSFADGQVFAASTVDDPNEPFGLVRLEAGRFKSVLHLNV